MQCLRFSAALSISPAFLIRLHFALVFLGCLIAITECQYSKIQYYRIYQAITNIQNCHASNNVIYTTADGKLNHLVGFKQVDEYNISVSKTHGLSCSKYGNQLEHSYVAVLDERGRVDVYEEVCHMLSIYMNYIGMLNNARYVSIGATFMAIVYEQTAHVYNVDKGISSPVLKIEINNKEGESSSKTEPAKWEYKDEIVECRAIQMDILGNFGVVIRVHHINTTQDEDMTQSSNSNGSLLIFQYYIIQHQTSSSVSHKLVLPFPHDPSQPITLDYMYSPEEGVTLTYLLTSASATSYIHYISSNNSLQYVSAPHLSPLSKLCDGELTYPHLQSVQKYATGTIITVDNIVTAFACTTDTGKYIHSLFYVTSRQGTTHYIDIYQDTDGFIDFLIGAGFCCCCFCLRICAKMPELFGPFCRVVGKGVVFLYDLLCWCPTKDNLQQIEDSLES